MYFRARASQGKIITITEEKHHKIIVKPILIELVMCYGQPLTPFQVTYGRR